MKIYTRAGDTGMTSLQDGKPIAKHSDTIVALAAIDEFCAFLGAAVAATDPDAAVAATDPGAAGAATDAAARQNFFIRTQLVCGAAMCMLSVGDAVPVAPKILTGRGYAEFFADETRQLENLMDAMNASALLRSFVTYGKNAASAAVDVARCVCRRAECHIAKLGDAFGDSADFRALQMYFNRLSDYLYLLAR